ncbi:hypothetical protein C0993_012632, partial [Termitomyces sp. T159_Od127]
TAPSQSSPTTTPLILPLECHLSMLTIKVTTPGSSSHVAHKVAQDLQSLHQFLQDKINIANKAYAKHADAHRGVTLNWTPSTIVWFNW